VLTELAYIVTVDNASGEWRALVYPLAVKGGLTLSGDEIVIQARAATADVVMALDNEAHAAASSALASAMPEPDDIA
jgi:hypothetical protein